MTNYTKNIFQNKLLLILIILFIFYSQTKSVFGEKVEGVALLRVIDGDTIVIYYDNKCESLRLIGIDAPESHVNSRAKRIALQTGENIKDIIERGKVSTDFMRGLLSEVDVISVEFDEQKRDKYHRLLGYAYLPDGEMLNNLIISEGYAQPLTIAPNTKYTEIFLEAFHSAITQQKGHWKQPH